MDDNLPPRKSWWSRNWTWVVPLGCLAPLLLVGGCVSILMVGVFSLLKSSGAYTDSLAIVRSDAQVQAALGAPIEAGYLVKGNLTVNNDNGSAQLNYDVSGPKDSATVNVVAEQANGKWKFEKLIVDVPSTGKQIDLSGPKQ